jgi:hypothetical protein
VDKTPYYFEFKTSGNDALTHGEDKVNQLVSGGTVIFVNNQTVEVNATKELSNVDKKSDKFKDIKDMFNFELEAIDEKDVPNEVKEKIEKTDATEETTSEKTETTEETTSEKTETTAETTSEKTDATEETTSKKTSITAKNDSDGNIKFDLCYDKNSAGTHYYRMSEVAGDDATIAYDSNKYIVAVNITINDQIDKTTNVETKSHSTKVTYFQLHKNDDGSESWESMNEGETPTFTNTGRQTSVTIEATKNLTGRLLTTNDIFDFEMKEYKYDEEKAKYVETGKTYTAKSASVENTNTSKITFASIPYYEAGKYYYEISEVQPKSKDEAIASVDYSTEVYRVYVDVTNSNESDTVNGNIYLTTKVTYQKKGSKGWDDNDKGAIKAKDVVFTNTYTSTGSLTVTDTKEC